LAEATAIVDTGVLANNLNLHSDEQKKAKEMPKDLRDKLLKTTYLLCAEAQDKNLETRFNDLVEHLFVEFNSSGTIRIDNARLYETIDETHACLSICGPEHLAENCDHTHPIYVAYDENSKAWQVSTVSFTFRGVIISSSDEDVVIQETSIANDKISDSSNNFQNMRLPPPPLHFSEYSTQVNSLSAAECSAHDKYPMPSANTSRNGEKKWKNQQRRRRKKQKSSSKNVCLPWQMLHSGLSRHSRERSQTSQVFLMSTPRQFRRLYPSCLKFWTLFLTGSGMRLSGILLFSSHLLDANTLCTRETSKLSSFGGGISN